MRFIFHTCFLLIASLLPHFIYGQTDSLAAGDTIHMYRQSGLFSGSTFYTFHGASKLGPNQLWPLLRQSPDAEVKNLTAKAHRRSTLYTSFIMGGYGLFLGGFASIKTPEVGASLLLGGAVSAYSGFIIGFGIGPATRRAVKRHNMVVRSRTEGFAAYYGPAAYQPTLADTVHTQQNRFFATFTYRGIRISPSTQLNTITNQLHDPGLNNGFRHSRTLRTIGGIVTGIGAGFISTYLLGYVAISGYRQRWLKPDARLYAALGAVGTGFVFRHVADRSETQSVARYNQAIRARFLFDNATN